jgi:hypothetical protein
VLACLGLAACGGSSNKSATSANAANTTTARTAAGNRLAAIRECLQKNGITLPQRPSGQPAPGVGGLLGGGGVGGPQLPKGVTRAQFQAALQKCGGGARRPGDPGGPGGQAGRRRFGTPAFRTALAAFATCMNRNGVKLPAPNTTGTGPVFSTKGVNTASASFKAASTKCQSVLRSAFPRRPRTGQAQQ